MLRDSVREQIPDATVEMSALSELTLLLDDDKTRIYDSHQGFDVADFSLVVFRTISGQLEAAIAVAAYCRKKGIPYIDRYIPAIGNFKMSCAFVRWEHGLLVPRTLYGPPESIQRVAAEGTLGWPIVVKADDGRKGQNNYLAHSAAEVQQIVATHPDTRFVVQAFIPNDGDYRILVLNDKPCLVILRKAAHGSHLNNTSQGGSAILVPLKEVPSDILRLARHAASLEKLVVAGVDVIIDRPTGRLYILEVNRAPQLTTGVRVDLKMQYYAETLRDILATNAKKGAQ